MSTQELSLETRKILWEIIKALQELLNADKLSKEDDAFFRAKITELVSIRDQLMEAQRHAADKKASFNQAR